MGLPIIVEIAIGLAFIYLILSLLASEIQELIATVLQWRAKHLKDSIINLFTGDIHSTHSVKKAQQLTKQVYQHPLVQGINQESRGLLPNFFRGITWIISYIYQVIAGKKEGEFNDQRTAPSYISREAFATSLLEQLGTKHFVERLVNAKFSRFIDLIKGKLEISLDFPKRRLDEYESLKKRFKDIEDEFIDKKIDLESAINVISQRLDIFLERLEKGSLSDQTIAKELQEWKSRFFVEEVTKSDIETEKIINNTEKIIKIFGLNPNLQEIVESIDKGSKIYNTYKDKFQTYEQKRFESVHADLTLFENFLSGFLKGMVKEFYGEKKEDFLQQWLLDIKKLDTEFLKRISNDSDKPKFESNKRPLSEINEVILEKLDECLKGIKPLKAQNGAATKLENSLKAFREGFTGEVYRFSLRHIWVFRASIFTKTVSFCLFLFLGLLIFAGLSNLSWLGSLSITLQTFLLSRLGGSIFLILLILAPLLLYRALKSFFSWRKRGRKKKWHRDVEGLDSEPKKSLSGIFDDYFASDEFASDMNQLSEGIKMSSDNDGDNTPGNHINTSQEVSQTEAGAVQKQETRFSQEISKRLREISEEPADIYDEMKDLGRSFRRYYLRFLLENADIDLVFIPSSVKQSLAVLIRRSKTSAKQAEDQIIHLKEEVEAWYDRSMERASGVYKRNAKGIAILIGIVLAIALNANSIHILDQLAFEQELREAVVQSAEKIAGQVVVESGELSDEAQNKLYRETSELLDDMNLPIGWNPDLIGEEFKCGVASEDEETSNSSDTQSEQPEEPVGPVKYDWDTLFQTCLYEKEFPNNQGDDQTQDTQSANSVKGLNNTTVQPPENFFPPTAIAAIFLKKPLVGFKFLLGWILTGIAISMGASFWFDLLSKLVKVRNTGKQVSTSSEASGIQKPAGTSK